MLFDASKESTTLNEAKRLVKIYSKNTYITNLIYLFNNPLSHL